MNNQKKTKEELIKELQRLQSEYNSLQARFDNDTSKKDEAKLKGLADIVENSINEIYVFDINTLKFKYVNTGALNNLGFSREEMFAITPLYIKPEFTHASFLQAVQPLLAGEKDKLNFETIHQRKDGSTYPVGMRLQISDYEGEKAFVAIIFDITDLKKTEADLIASESNLLALINNKEQAIWSVDRNYNLIVCNDYFRDYFFAAYQVKLKVGMNLLEILNPELRASWKPKHEKALAGQKVSFEFSETIQDKIYYFNIYLNPIRVQDKITGVSALSVDVTEEKLAKMALADSEERYRKFIENNEAVMLEVNPDDGSIIFANNSAVEFYGWEKEQLLKMNINQLVVLSPDEIKAKMAKVRKKKHNHFTFKHRLANGSMRDVEVYQSTINFKNKELFSLIIHDITQRKKAEESLKLAEFKFRTFADYTYDWEYWEDEHNKIVYMSPSCENITGYKAEEFASNSELLFSIIHPDDVAAFQKHHEKHHEEYYLFQNRHELDEIKFRIIKEDGSNATIHHYCRPIFDSNGKFLGCRVSNRDVTRQELAFSALREKEERYRQMFQFSPDSIILHDMEMNIIDVNDRALEEFGYQKEEFINKTVYELHTKDELSHSKKVLNMMKKQKMMRMEPKFVRKDGSTFLAEAIPCKYTLDGKPIIHVVIRNITKLKEYENELIAAKEKAEETDRLKSAFLANMSHEIRTPMNGILGFTNLLNNMNLDELERKEYIAIINKSGERLMNTINNLIDISKVEAGQMKVVKTETSINKMLDELYGFFSPEAAGKGLSLTLLPSSSNTEATVLTDNNKLHGILTNLIKNAIKYTDEGSISFGYVHKDDFIKFYVKDTGIGVPKNRQQAIFNRFEQSDIENTRTFEGTGLGLAISKAYVEMLGGKIWVISEEGRGSEFGFTIPYKTKAAQKPESVSKTLNKLPGETVSTNSNLLIVEDKETNSFFLKMILKDRFRNIWVAKTGKEAIEQCREHPEINLVLMDIKMPELDGYEATREIRTFNKKVIIIAQTAHALAGDREKAIAAGCDDYISKPIVKDKLLALIQKHFDSFNI